MAAPAPRLLLATALLPLALAAPWAVAQEGAPSALQQDGPLPALAGVPIEFDCVATLPLDHPALRRYPGEDGEDLARSAGLPDPATWLDQTLCGYLWDELESAGAHAAPRDVRLPARGVLVARLQRVWIEGSRVIEQRIGSTIMPVSVPHWAVATAWELDFAVAYAGSADERTGEGSLTFELAGAAEQDDYAALRLDSLLRGASLDTFSDLPRVLADDGHLGDLLFAVVPTPAGAPQILGLDGPSAEGFWQLLSTRSEQRHDAMAFYLSADRLDRARRVELARWFLLNDPDVSLRRDALGWLLQQEDPDTDQGFSEPMMDLLGWLVLRERSSRVRAEAVRVLSTRPGEQVRSLLVAASTDPDKRVSDRATSGLRREPPPTAAELATTPAAPSMPSLAAWTASLDGRVAPRDPAPQSLVALALAVGGPAADAWLVRWAAKGKTTPGDQPWVLDAWSRMVAEGSPRVRVHTLERMGRDAGQASVAALIEQRVKLEREPTVRAAAISALRAFGRPGLDTLLVDASRDSDPDVRIAAVEAMTSVPGARVDERLQQLASGDPDNRVKRKARRVLRVRAKEAWDQG